MAIDRAQPSRLSESSKVSVCIQKMSLAVVEGGIRRSLRAHTGRIYRPIEADCSTESSQCIPYHEIYISKSYSRNGQCTSTVHEPCSVATNPSNRLAMASSSLSIAVAPPCRKVSRPIGKQAGHKPRPRTSAIVFFAHLLKWSATAGVGRQEPSAICDVVVIVVVSRRSYKYCSQLASDRKLVARTRCHMNCQNIENRI